jgi:hypothetical protein
VTTFLIFHLALRHIFQDFHSETTQEQDDQRDLNGMNSNEHSLSLWMFFHWLQCFYGTKWQVQDALPLLPFTSARRRK